MMRSKFRLPFCGANCRRHAALLLIVLLPTMALATPIPVEDLFKNADVVAAQLSPDGKSVALTTSVNGRKCLAVMDVDSGKLQEVAAYADAQIGAFSWVSNKRLIYSVTHMFDQHNWGGTGYVDDGLFAVDRDGSDSKILIPTYATQIEHRARMVQSLHLVGYFNDQPDEILVWQVNNKEPGISAFRLNTRNGKRWEINIGVKGEVHAFWTDHTSTIRLVKTASDDISSETLWYRDAGDAPWKKIGELNKLATQFEPLGFDTDNKTLFVSARSGSDKAAIYKFDFAKNAIGAVFYANDEADVTGGLTFARDTHKLFGVRYIGDQPGVLWLDKNRADIQNAIDNALPGQVNDVSGDEHAAGLLVHSYSDTNPGIFYFYNQETHKLKKLFSARPWIHTDDLSEQSIFHYSARDGLDIPAYLTLPKGKPVRRLPLIVLAHGGPWSRDYWGFDDEVQFLASRGYAVLQPQFRSSFGYGFTLFRKGWKQWGQSMQDDITDGVRNLIKQGVVDSSRVCIMGASYGGYAAMMGVAKDPALYRCAVDMFGMTDIKLQMDISDWASDGNDEIRRYEIKELVGDPSSDSELFDANSPLRLAGKIKAPVLMVYGGKDNRVPKKEGEQLRDVLQKQGNVVEWMELEDEGHGFQNKESDRFLFYGKLDAFLKKYDPVD